MLREIERINGHVIQKVTSNKDGSLIRYQAFPADKVGDASAIKTCASNSLDELRKMLGYVPNGSGEKTLPKSAHPQNQKGYDPHSHRNK